MNSFTAKITKSDGVVDFRFFTYDTVNNTETLSRSVLAEIAEVSEISIDPSGLSFLRKLARRNFTTGIISFKTSEIVKKKGKTVVVAHSFALNTEDNHFSQNRTVGVYKTFVKDLVKSSNIDTIQSVIDTVVTDNKATFNGQTLVDWAFGTSKVRNANYVTVVFKKANGKNATRAFKCPNADTFLSRVVLN